MRWFNTRDIIHFYNLFIPGSYHIRAECTILNKYRNTKTVKHSSDWNESCKMGNRLVMVFKASIPCRIQWKWKVYRHSLEKIWFNKKIYNKIKQRSSTKQFLKSSELYKKYTKIPAAGEKFLSRQEENRYFTWPPIWYFLEAIMFVWTCFTLAAVLDTQPLFSTFVLADTVLNIMTSEMCDCFPLFLLLIDSISL